MTGKFLFLGLFKAHKHEVTWVSKWGGNVPLKLRFQCCHLCVCMCVKILCTYYKLSPCICLLKVHESCSACKCPGSEDNEDEEESEGILCVFGGTLW